MLCTTVALNLEGAPLEMEAAANPRILATLGGMNFRHVLSTVLAALPQALGGPRNHPIPDSFPPAEERGELAYTFTCTVLDDVPIPQDRWSRGENFAGRSTFSAQKLRATDDVPTLAKAPLHSAAQASQVQPLGEVLDVIDP